MVFYFTIALKTIMLYQYKAIFYFPESVTLVHKCRPFRNSSSASGAVGDSRFLTFPCFSLKSVENGPRTAPSGKSKFFKYQHFPVGRTARFGVPKNLRGRTSSGHLLISLLSNYLRALSGSEFVRVRNLQCFWRRRCHVAGLIFPGCAYPILR